VLDVNASDDEHTIFRFLDFSANLSRQFSVCLDFARLQRAPEGSQQSTCDGCNQIINRCRMGLSEILGLHSIVLGNGAMHAKDHRLGFPR
jgi:hypothetical protein